MKPITILFEIDFNNHGGKTAWIPGWFSARFNDGYFRRTWWLCFAIAWVRMDLHDYNRYIASGRTEWREQNT